MMTKRDRYGSTVPSGLECQLAAGPGTLCRANFRRPSGPATPLQDSSATAVLADERQKETTLKRL